MKNKPADWQPLPEVYRLERERVRQEALDRQIAKARAWREQARQRA